MSRLTVVTALVGALLVSSVKSNDYCHIKRTHTMCAYQDTKPGPNCKNYEPHPLLQEDITMLLEMHNSFRARVATGREDRGKPGPQPTAAYMFQLTWDEELAVIAQRWADQCNIENHDKNRNVARFHVGQNIGTSSDYSPTFKSDIRTIMDLMYEEVQHFNANTISHWIDRSDYGHYTALVWGETYLVGCGRAFFRPPSPDNKSYEYLVCNYGPGGDITGRPVYKVGPPASSCPGNTPSTEYKGLCIKIDGKNYTRPKSSGNKKVTNQPTTTKKYEQYDFKTYDYCKLNSGHTMCKFKTSEPGSKCSGYKAHELSSHEMELLLEEHNTLRGQVAQGFEEKGKPGPQETATNMYRLKWDPELALIAKRWADQCILNKNDDFRHVVNFNVSQNMAAVDSSDDINQDIIAIVSKWYSEVQKFNKESIFQYKKNAETDHYTAMMWANSHRLGCGLAVFVAPNSDADTVEQRSLVCNYGPGGNVNDESVYDAGPKASACPGEVSKEFEGLCTSNGGVTIVTTTQKVVSTTTAMTTTTTATRRQQKVTTPPRAPVSSNDNEYCALSKDHTMCLYESKKPGLSCGKYFNYPLTRNEINLLVYEHNLLRNRVAMGQEKRGNPGPQPAAEHMYELTWDTELAKVAQRWADQCTIGVTDKNRQVGRFGVTQNVVTLGEEVDFFVSDIRGLVRKWYNEVEAFNPKSSGKVFNNFTAMVWAGTSLVGCGRSVFMSPNRKDLNLYEHLVCNYGPGGNIPGGQVYIPQSQMSVLKCPRGQPSRRFRGLCQAVKTYQGKKFNFRPLQGRGSSQYTEAQKPLTPVNKSKVLNKEFPRRLQKIITSTKSQRRSPQISFKHGHRSAPTGTFKH